MLIGVGYFFLYYGMIVWTLLGNKHLHILAYVKGEGSVTLPWLCLFAFFTGSGSASAFAGAIKTCKLRLVRFKSFWRSLAYHFAAALNWPNHRGTATAFPLAAFGLSAFVFATLSTAAFPNNISDFLLLLAIGTFCLPFFSNFFLRVVPHSLSYTAIPSHGQTTLQANRLHRTKSGDSKRSSGRYSPEPGMQSNFLFRITRYTRTLNLKPSLSAY